VSITVHRHHEVVVSDIIGEAVVNVTAVERHAGIYHNVASFWARGAVEDQVIVVRLDIDT
jgi:hypothetical protein